MKKLPALFNALDYRTTFIISLFAIAVGVILDNRMENNSLGTVLIAVGGLLLIITMIKKKKERS